MLCAAESAVITLLQDVTGLTSKVRFTGAITLEPNGHTISGDVAQEISLGRITNGLITNAGTLTISGPGTLSNVSGPTITNNGTLTVTPTSAGSLSVTGKTGVCNYRTFTSSGININCSDRGIMSRIAYEEEAETYSNPVVTLDKTASDSADIIINAASAGSSIGMDIRGQLVMNGCQVSADYYGLYVSGSDAIVSVTDCQISADQWAVYLEKNILSDAISINDSTLTAVDEYGYFNIAIENNCESATLTNCTLEGHVTNVAGSVTLKDCIGVSGKISCQAGTVNITGNETKAFKLGGSTEKNDSAVISIDAKKVVFTDDAKASVENNGIDIDNRTFISNTDAETAADYPWTLKDPNVEALIGNESYNLLSTAAALVKDGEIILLQKDITTDEDVYISKSATVNFSNYAYSGKITTTSAADVTLKKGTLGQLVNKGTATLTDLSVTTLTNTGSCTLGQGVTCKDLMNEGNVTITDGTYTGALTNNGAGTFSILGGKYSGILTNNGQAGSVTISGGYYAQSPDSSYLAEGYVIEDSSEYEGYPYHVVTDYVAKVIWSGTEESFADLSSAVAEANKLSAYGEATLKIIASQTNLAVTSAMDITGQVVLDLNGHTLEAASDVKALVCENGSKVTIKDTAGNAGTLSSSSLNTVEVQSGAQLTIENGIVKNMSSGDNSAVSSAGTVTQKGGSVISADSGAAVVNSGTYTMRGGHLTGATAVVKSTGTLEIADGFVSGGVVASSGSCTLTGGYYAQSPDSSYLAKYYVIEESSEYAGYPYHVVESTNYAAVVIYNGAEDSYLDPESAISAANSRATYGAEATVKITAHQDSLTLTSAMDITGNVTVDLNGHTLEAASDVKALVCQNGSKVTIKDTAGNAGTLSSSSLDTVEVQSGAQLTVESGTVENASSSDNSAVSNAGTVTMKGGYLMGATAVKSTGTLKIHGGFVSGKITAESGSCKLSGGYYSERPDSNYLTAGYEITEDGAYAAYPYHVSLSADVKVTLTVEGDTGYYVSLAAAAAAIPVGCSSAELKLLANISDETAAIVAENTGAILDLNGFSVTGDCVDALITVSGSLDIVNSQEADSTLTNTGGVVLYTDDSGSVRMLPSEGDSAANNIIVNGDLTHNGLGSFTIYGGKYTGTLTNNADISGMVVSGGYFKTAFDTESIALAEDHSLYQSGLTDYPWQVGKYENVVCSVQLKEGDSVSIVQYASLETALSAANAADSAVITLAKDVTGLTSAASFTGTITLEPDGHAISGEVAESDTNGLIKNTGTLTISGPGTISNPDGTAIYSEGTLTVTPTSAGSLSVNGNTGVHNCATFTSNGIKITSVERGIYNRSKDGASSAELPVVTLDKTASGSADIIIEQTSIVSPQYAAINSMGNLYLNGCEISGGYQGLDCWGYAEGTTKVISVTNCRISASLDAAVLLAGTGTASITNSTLETETFVGCAIDNNLDGTTLTNCTLDGNVLNTRRAITLKDCDEVTGAISSDSGTVYIMGNETVAFKLGTGVEATGSAVIRMDAKKMVFSDAAKESIEENNIDTRGRAFVENTDTETSAVYPWMFAQTEPVALVGDVPYYTLAAAAAALTGGETIKLQKDIALEESVQIKAAATLDMNGFSLTGDCADALITVSGSLDIVNSQEADSTLTNTGGVVLYTDDSGSVRLLPSESESAANNIIVNGDLTHNGLGSFAIYGGKYAGRLTNNADISGMVVSGGYFKSAFDTESIALAEDHSLYLSGLSDYPWQVGKSENVVCSVQLKQGDSVTIVEYASFDAAVSAANEADSAVVTLLKDMTGLTSAVLFTGDITLEPNGHTISGEIAESETDGLIKNTGSLTISGPGTISNSSGSAICNDGTLTVEPTSAGALTVNGKTDIYNSGNATVTGISLTTLTNTGSCDLGEGVTLKDFTNKGNASITDGSYTGTIQNDIYSSTFEKEEYTLTVSGGTFSSGCTVTNSESMLISGGTFSSDCTVINNESMTVSGGTFASGSAVTNAKSMTVSDGTFSSGCTVTNNESMTVCGGTFAAGCTITNNKSMRVEGGFFANSESTPCIGGTGTLEMYAGYFTTKEMIPTPAEGREICTLSSSDPYYEQGYRYVVSAEQFVRVTIGETEATYASLAEAIASVPDGSSAKLTLMKSISGQTAVSIAANTNITLDMNGLDITGSCTDALITASGSLNIINGQASDSTLSNASGPALCTNGSGDICIPPSNNAEAADNIIVNGDLTHTGTGVFAIYIGRYSGTLTNNGEAGSMFVCGGYYASAPDERLLAEECTVEQSSEYAGYPYHVTGTTYVEAALTVNGSTSYYESLALAAAAIPAECSGAEIKLLCDPKNRDDFTLKNAASVIFDFNSYAYSGKITSDSIADVTLKNGTLGELVNNGKASLTDLNITTLTNTGSCALGEGVVLKDFTNKGNATITDGTYTGTILNDTYSSTLTKETYTLTVSGGTFAAGCTVTNSESMMISGGTFASGCTITNNGSMLISGGKYAGTLTNNGAASAMIVSGGYFKTKFDTAKITVADGKSLYLSGLEDYPWLVGDAGNVVCTVQLTTGSSVTTESYTSFEAAVAAANKADSAVITLSKDVTGLTDTINFTGNITLVPDGHTISGKAVGIVIGGPGMLNNTGTLTIKGAGTLSMEDGGAISNSGTLTVQPTGSDVLVIKGRTGVSNSGTFTSSGVDIQGEDYGIYNAESNDDASASDDLPTVTLDNTGENAGKILVKASSSSGTAIYNTGNLTLNGGEYSLSINSEGTGLELTKGASGKISGASIVGEVAIAVAAGATLTVLKSCTVKGLLTFAGAIIGAGLLTALGKAAIDSLLDWFKKHSKDPEDPEHPEIYTVEAIVITDYQSKCYPTVEDANLAANDYLDDGTSCELHVLKRTTSVALSFTGSDSASATLTTDVALEGSVASSGISFLNLASGTLTGPVNASTGLTVSGFTVNGNVTVAPSGNACAFNVNGGTVNGSATVSGNTTMLVCGGSITGNVTASGNSVVTVSAGSINGNVLASGNVAVNVAGGTIGTITSAEEIFEKDSSGALADTKPHIELTGSASLNATGVVNANIRNQGSGAVVINGAFEVFGYIHNAGSGTLSITGATIEGYVYNCSNFEGDNAVVITDAKIIGVMPAAVDAFTWPESKFTDWVAEKATAGSLYNFSQSKCTVAVTNSEIMKGIRSLNMNPESKIALTEVTCSGGITVMGKLTATNCRIAGTTSGISVYGNGYDGNKEPDLASAVQIDGGTITAGASSGISNTGYAVVKLTGVAINVVDKGVSISGGKLDMKNCEVTGGYKGLAITRDTSGSSTKATIMDCELNGIYEAVVIDGCDDVTIKSSQLLSFYNDVFGSALDNTAEGTELTGCTLNGNVVNKGTVTLDDCTGVSGTIKCESGNVDITGNKTEAFKLGKGVETEDSAVINMIAEKMIFTDEAKTSSESSNVTTGNRKFAANPDTETSADYPWALVDIVYVIKASSDIGQITGGGEYKAGSQVTLTASAVDGYDFTGWFRNSVCESTDLTYTFTASSDADYVAVYTPKRDTNFTLEVIGSQFSVTGQSGTQEVSGRYTYGASEEVTVTYTDESKTFLYWANTYEKIVSRDAQYTFIIGSNTDIHAVCADESLEGTSYVVFLSAYDQIIASATYTENDTISFPTAPSKMGFTFDKWIISGTTTEATEENIKSAMKDNATIKVVPVYKSDGDTYKINVYYQVDGEEGDSLTATYTLNSGAAKELEAAETYNGKAFSYWSNGPDTLSYSRNYLVHAAADVTLYAVYGAETTAVGTSTITEVTKSMNGAKYRLSFSESYSIPDDCTMVKTGFIATSEETLATSAAMILDAANTKTYTASSTTATYGVYTLHLNMTNPDRKIWVRGYVQYQSADGTLHTVYSDIGGYSYNDLMG